MAANRKLPFGYEMSSGCVRLHPEESETVRWIYRQYLAGQSYQKLTEDLQRRAVPYLTGKAWNKNMVARILADERYLGTETMPPVIELSLYRAVRELLPIKAPVRKKSGAANIIQQMAMCTTCGARVLRASNQHGKERWYCPACGTISTKANDLRLEQGMKRALKRLRCEPEMVTLGPCSDGAATEHITEKEMAFQTMLDTPEFDEALAKQLALDLASARLDALGSEDFEAMRIRWCLKSSGTDDLNLLRQIADTILIQPDGRVSLSLKNRQNIDEE